MRLGGVIVAAGCSSRMGAFKPLLPLDEMKTPILRQEVNLLLSQGVSHVLVVTGHRAKEVERTLSGSPKTVRTVYNPNYREDMFRSVQAGVAALPEGIDGFFFLPADCPAVEPATLERLAAAFETVCPPLCVPQYGGRRGHPPLISTELKGPLLAYDGEGGLKQFLRQYQALEIPVDDPEIMRDMDTPEEYQALLSARQRRRCREHM